MGSELRKIGTDIAYLSIVCQISTEALNDMAVVRIGRVEATIISVVSMYESDK